MAEVQVSDPSRHYRNELRPSSDIRTLEYGLSVMSLTMTESDVRQYFVQVHLSSSIRHCFYRTWEGSQATGKAPQAVFLLRSSCYGAIIQDRSIILELLKDEGKYIDYEDHWVRLERLKARLNGCTLALERANDALVAREQASQVRFHPPEISKNLPRKFWLIVDRGTPRSAPSGSRSTTTGLSGSATSLWFGSQIFPPKISNSL